MTLEELCAEHIPGWQIRLRLLRNGAEWQREALIADIDTIIAKRRKAAAGGPYSTTLTFDEVLGLLKDE